MIDRHGHRIGLSLGTRSTGLAVMHKGVLKDYKIFVFKKKWSKKKLRTILQRITSLLLIPGCMVAIKVPPPVYCSKQLDELSAALREFFADKGIRYKLLTIKDLKAHCFPRQKSNKKHIIESVSQKYPELFLKCQLESKMRHAYYFKLFEATVAAEIISKKNVH